MARWISIVMIICFGSLLAGMQGCENKADKRRITALSGEHSPEEKYQRAYTFWRSSHDKMADSMKSQNPLGWRAGYSRLNSSLNSLARYIRQNHPEKADGINQIMVEYKELYERLSSKVTASSGMLDTMRKLKNRVEADYHIARLDPEFYRSKRQSVMSAKEKNRIEKRKQNREETERKRLERKKKREEKRHKKEEEKNIE